MMDTYSVPCCCWMPMENPHNDGKVGFPPHLKSPTPAHIGPTKDLAASRMAAESVAPSFMNFTMVMSEPNVGPPKPVYSGFSTPVSLAQASAASM